MLSVEDALECCGTSLFGRHNRVSGYSDACEDLTDTARNMDSSLAFV